MKIIKIDKKNINQKDVDLIVDYLKSGKVVALPTDTLYGLHCETDNAWAIKKIYQIKKRPVNKNFLILVNSWEMAKKYAYLSQKQINYLKTLWPGRVSAILKKKALDKKTIQIDDSIAIRMPDDKFLQTIIKKLKKPIISTSLNITHQPVLSDLSKIEKYFTEHQPDLTVDIGIIKNKKASKLIDIRDIEDIKILRK